MQGQLEGFKSGAVVLLVAAEGYAVAPDAEVRLAEIVELDTPAKQALDDFLKVSANLRNFTIPTPIIIIRTHPRRSL